MLWFSKTYIATVSTGHVANCVLFNSLCDLHLLRITHTSPVHCSKMFLTKTKLKICQIGFGPECWFFEQNPARVSVLVDPIPELELND